VKHSDFAPGHSFDFGDFKLTVGFLYNRNFAKLASFWGLLSTQGPSGLTDSVSEISFEMPLEVESVEQCAAWIGWHVDRTGRTARGGRVAWLEMGRKHLVALPWLRQQASYDARPHCAAERDWVKVALKKLREMLKTADQNTNVSFGFDGTVMSIICGQQVIRLQAEGAAWSKSYRVAAANLRDLPKRLSARWVDFSVFEGKLSFGNRAYNT
jgi:hypothetical protein